jgi:hypothetical protein
LKWNSRREIIIKEKKKKEDLTYREVKIRDELVELRKRSKQSMGFAPLQSEAYSAVFNELGFGRIFLLGFFISMYIMYSYT